jgi:hypothetical protein
VFVERIVRSLLFLAALVLGALGWGLVLTNASGTSDLTIGIFLLVLGVAIGVIVILAPTWRRSSSRAAPDARPDRISYWASQERAEQSAGESEPDRRDDLMQRWRIELAEVRSRLEILLSNRQLWTDQQDASTTQTLARRTRLYVDGQLTAFGRVIVGDDRDSSLDHLLGDIQTNAHVLTVDQVLTSTMTAKQETPATRALREHFLTVWDGGAGHVDPLVIARDRNDLSELLIRVREWADALARRDDAEFISTSFVDLDYAISHTNEIVARYEELLTGKPITPASPIAPEVLSRSAVDDFGSEPRVPQEPIFEAPARPTFQPLPTPRTHPDPETVPGRAYELLHEERPRQQSDEARQIPFPQTSPALSPPVTPPSRAVSSSHEQLASSRNQSAEHSFLLLGEPAEDFLRAASVRGLLFDHDDFTELSDLIDAYGGEAVGAALRSAVEYRRFLPSDVRAILRSGIGVSEANRTLAALLEELPSVPERAISDYRTDELA